MNGISGYCFICNGTKFSMATEDYQRCHICGHEVLVTTQMQGFIINDNLSEKEVFHITKLDQFKALVLSSFDSKIKKNELFDIGSASGKFLYHNANRYLHATGIEITPESLTFSRKKLKLNIIENIQDAPDDISVATAWHSLEHIPEQQLLSLLEGVSNKMTEGSRLIVSVPNAGSWQYRWFRKSYAYYDVPNHLHQFTVDSLEILMKRFGFYLVESVDSRPYNTFGYTQGLLNIITCTHNYLYYRLKRRSWKPSLLLDIVNGSLLIFVVPFGWLLGRLDSFNLKHQGVITSCFEKTKC